MKGYKMTANKLNLSGSNLNGYSIMNAEHRAGVKGAYWFINQDRTLIAYLNPTYAKINLCEYCFDSDDTEMPQESSYTISGKSACSDCAYQLVKDCPKLESDLYA